MKKSKKRTSIITLIIAVALLSAVPHLVKAQSTYKLVPGNGTSIKILGSSNVHDWTMISKTLESQGEFNLADHALQSLMLHLAVTTLKSEHSSMNERTYAAVNAKNFPEISYKLTSAEIVPNSNNKYLIKSKGDLTIAGVKQNISMDVTATANDENTITCSGSKKILLTDYGIKPPSYMLGAMKVANELTIQFNLIYKK